MTGEPPPPMPARVSAWSVYDVFKLADGELFVGAVSDKQWQTLCTVLERPDLASDPSLATNEQRVSVRPALLARLGEAFSRHSVDAMAAKLEAAKLPYAPIRRPEQLFDDPHLRASGGLVPMQTEEGTSTEVPLLPLMMDGRRLGVQRPLPRIGEHTDDVLREVAARAPDDAVIEHGGPAATNRRNHEYDIRSTALAARSRAGSFRARCACADNGQAVARHPARERGLRRRHDRPRHGTAARQGARPAGRHREPSGRRRDHRDVGAREGAGRRQHDRRAVEQSRDQSQRVQDAALRHAERHHTDHGRRFDAVRARRQSDRSFRRRT